MPDDSYNGGTPPYAEHYSLREGLELSPPIQPGMSGSPDPSRPARVIKFFSVSIPFDRLKTMFKRRKK